MDIGAKKNIVKNWFMILQDIISNDIEKLYQLIIEQEANELIIGLPLLLSGQEGAQVRLVKSFVNLLNPFS